MDLEVDAFIEIPKYSQNKYEWDEERRVFRLDRTLYSPVHYPTDYGFVPETLAADGDAVDIMVMVSVPTFPGCVVRARVIGALVMEDQEEKDVKLLSVSVRDPRYAGIHELPDVPPHILKEIEYFFSIYKDLEGKKTVVHGWEGVEAARSLLAQAQEAYRERHKEARK